MSAKPVKVTVSLLATANLSVTSFSRGVEVSPASVGVPMMVSVSSYVIALSRESSLFGATFSVTLAPEASLPSTGRPVTSKYASESRLSVTAPVPAFLTVMVFPSITFDEPTRAKKSKLEGVTSRL